MSSSEDDDFGQKLPPLYLYLKRILDKYPEGGQILKEIIQNADDAGATEVKFLYDDSDYPVDNLWSDDLKKYHGPALYAYNNTTFSDQDWLNIQRPEQSGKREDPLKVGRFGLGFNSIYHITDLPSVLSGNWLGIFDPLENIFSYDPYKKKQYTNKPGKKWKLKGELLAPDCIPYSGQFAPYLGVFECNESSFERGYFGGTLFRFPLRKEPSKLSSNVISKDRIMGKEGWITTFQDDIDLTLLFLKNIESISIYERKGKYGEVELIQEARITETTRHQLRGSKTTFLQQVKQNKESGPLSMEMEIEVTEKTHKAVKRWIVVHQVKKSGLSIELKKLSEDNDLGLMPWVGTAVEMVEANTIHISDGRIFCFLPLPPSQTTGLPVHIHGYFGLGDNRRSIKWPDAESKNDKTARWNRLLTCDAIPEAYAHLIMTAITVFKWKPDCVYRAWPDIQKVTSVEWQQVFKKLFSLLLVKEVFYSKVLGGKWLKLGDAAFDHPTSYKSKGNQEAVVKTMLDCCAPVVTLPPHVMKCLEHFRVHIKKITPHLVRLYLRKNTRTLESMDRKTKLQLLAYIIEDGSYAELEGLPLLPLANGNFIPFSKKYQASKIFIETEEHKQSLLPNMDVVFLDPTLSHDLRLMLREACCATQLTLLTPTHVLDNLSSALPYNWTTSNAQNTIIWHPDKKREPPINWLGDFWSWFERQRGVDTSTLEGLPLIPLDADTYSGPITLLKLKKNGPSAIFKKTSSWQYQAVLNDEIASIIENIGCYIVRNQQSYLSQSSLGKYIASPDVDGVLKVLKFAGPLKITQLIKNCPQLSKQLSKYLCKLTNLLADDFTFLKQLPLWECTNDNYPVSLNQCNMVTPNNYLELPCRRVKQSLLVCDEHSVLQFALSLGAIQIPFHKYLEQYILPGLESGYYSETESKGIMEWITNHSEYDDIVKRHRCILTKCGSLVKPCDAIDPNSIQLVLLLGDQCVPAEHYYEGRLLKHIRRIGMKAEDSISSTELYNIAKRLDSCKNSADENNVRKGGALLKYLEKYSWKLKEQVDVQRVRKSLSQRIMSLAWIPCLDHKPSRYMNSIEWFGEQNNNNLKLFSPKDVTIFENSMLIGGVMPIVKMTHLNKQLTNTFSWTHPLDGKKYEHVRCVVRQLKMIVSTTKEQQQPNLRQIRDTVIEIYKFLATSNIELVKPFIYDDSALGNFEWVWHGKGFTNQDKVALTQSLDVDLQPYLCILPVELASEFRTFFQAMGIHDKFSSTVLSDVLRSIKDSNFDKVSPEKYHADLNLACAILKAISSSGPVDDELHRNVLVPTNQSQDGNLEMMPASNCFYRDREWLTEKLADDNYSIIHEDVPNVTARNLGLRPLSQHVAPTDGLGYDLAGPHETVINAIKRNLDMYKEGVGIFKELIQNADDAGASEVKFLIDQRSNKQIQERLLDPEMKHCHGPALWAYNNALFTDDDIKNICDIAAASKKEKREKIGRFGLGFTSVYHVTDAPSLISGPYIMMFDPRLIHLRSRIHNPAQPGVKLDLRNQRHRQTVATYPHQFQPYYRVFGCDITKDNYYEGTLFRLPLRTAYQVSHDTDNLISDKIYQDETALQKLVLSLEKSAHTLLLFTQNVKKLSVLKLKSGSHDGKDAVEIFSINVTLVQQLPRCMTHESVLHLTPLQEQANILKATSHWMEQSKESPPESTHLVAIKITSKLSKSTKKSTLKQHWLVSSCASNGVSLMLANQPEGRLQGVLPCAGVAALMKQSEDGLIPDPVKGQLFSFLPLAVPTGLPIHFNASFALQPNRRHIWSKATQIHDGSEWREFEAEWNHDLMTDVLCKAFINLLTDLAGMHDLVGKYDFQILWPKLDKCESDFHPFLMAFYQKICGPADLQPAVIYNESKWVTLTRCLFVDEDISQSRIRNEAIILLNQQLYQKKVVTFNEAITRSIKKSGAADLLDKNTYDIRKLYTEVFFDCVDDISCDIRNPLVTYLLDIRMGAQQIRLFDDLLKNVECIPVSPDGVSVDKPCNLVHPESLVGALFKDSDGRFPYTKELQMHKQERLLSLTELGMATTRLSWEDICERASSVVDVLDTDGLTAAVERVKIILKVMNKVITSGCEPSVDEKAKLSSIVFLPVLQKPRDYPLKWWANKLNILNGRRLYGCKAVNVIGSVAAVLDEHLLDRTLLTDNVMDILGIKTEVPVSEVVSQLEELIQCRNPKETLDVCKSVYQLLETKLCRSSRSDTGKEIFHIIEGQEDTMNKLKVLKMFWVHDTFVSADKMSFQWTENTIPYLYKVPREIIQYKKLLSTCGVREQFEVNDFINVLEELSHKRREHQLEPPECKIALILLRELCEKTSSSVDLEDKDIYVPDNNNVLRSSKDLTFNDDAPWLQQNSHYTFAHKDVPWSHAEKLGIVAARYKKAQEFSSLMGFAHEFGQKEELTNRLKDILKAYPGGSEIFKELLQNADDAKATEIHIIYDQRSHPSQMIVGDSWATMQKRPAICVYNNRVFSDEDIEGIQQVGIGGKRSDAETTGQYGIGFNSVYHLTDCPTFISDNEKLGIFDPHLKYITGASVNKPGILFDPVSELQSSFKDMLSGYLGDYIKLEGGTLFRFPLRQESDISDISNSTYGSSDVRELIRQFKSNAFDSLMFLNHIKTIKLSEITTSAELKQLYVVGVEMTENDTLKREDMAKHISQHKNTTVVDIPVKVTNYHLCIKDSNHREEDWLIVQQFGFSERPDEHLAHEDIGRLLPRAGVAAMVSEHTPVATKYPSYIRPGMSSPAPAVKKMTKQKYVYCFLPLPIETDLPVNVNGHFALDRSRRYLWRDEGSRQSFRGAWNEQLISKALAPAYSTLLNVAAQKYVVNFKEDSYMDEMKSKDLEWYHGLFPLVRKDITEVTGTRKDEWTFLAEQTMVYIATMHMKVLPMIKHSGLDGEVISWNEPFTEDNRAFFDSLGRENTGNLIRSFLMASGFNLLASPMTIHDSFLHSGVNVHEVTPISIVHFMHSDPCAVGDLPCGIDVSTYKTVKSYLEVLKYVLTCIEDPQELIGLPLQLCADNTVGVFGTYDVPYLSTFTDLLPSLKQKFLSQDIHLILRKFIDRLNSSITVNVWQDLTPHELSRHLCSVLPDEWENVPHSIKLSDVANKEIYIQWLQLLWKYLCARTDADPLCHLQSWPIIPITESSLMSPSNGKHVLNLLSREDGRGFQFRVIQLLRKLRCPEVSQEIIEHKLCTKERVAKLLKPYVVFPEECKDVLSLIDYLINKRSICFDSISKYEAETFLQYFQEEIESYSQEHIDILKKLPLYEKNSGELTSVHSYSKCHLLSGSFPEVPDGLWNKCSCVFLSPKHHLELLLQGIGASAINVFDVYKMYIIPNFHIFSNQSRVAHLKYIRDTLMPSHLNSEQQEHIIRILSSVELIPSEDGTLKRVDYFFDPKNKMFMEMEDKCYHLPKEFADDYRWGNFLERLGLKTTVTKSLFLQYVNRVATSAIRCTSAALKPILCKSKLLAGELNNNNDLRTPDTFQEISKIKFIPSARVRHDLCDIHHPFLREGTDVIPFICYNGNISEYHVELAWTSCFLLPQWAIPTRYEYIRNKRVDLHQYLGISNEQSLDSVINHCQNICDRMAQQNCPETEDSVPRKTRETLSSVLIEIYKYLQQNINNTPLKTKLSNTPLVLVDNGKMLVRANQLAYKFGPLPSDALQPYMYTPPRALGQYDELFQQLGTEENATFQQYACVLASIKERCKDNIMDPNEKKKALLATKALFHYLSDDTCKNNKESVNRLYLPSTSDKLKLSNELYCGSNHLIHRIDQSEYDFILPLTECGCDVTKENMSVNLLPEKNRPKDVGKVVSEKLSLHAKPCIAESCDYICHFKEMLSSEELALALKRIIRYQQGVKFLDTARKDQIARLKTKLRIHCMRKLETMMYNPAKEEYIDRSEKQQQIFMSESEDGFDLYLNHGDIPVEVRLLGKLVRKLNMVISWQLKDCSIVQTLLSKGVEHFEDILSEDYHIPEYDQIEGVKENETSPGKPVPEDIVHLLNDDPINTFRAGEVVALRKSIQEADGAESESGEYVFAEVIAVLDVHTDSDDTLGLKRKYKVNTGGSEPVEVSCNDLFKFKRPEEPKPKDLEVYTGAGENNESEARAREDISLADAKSKIKKTLEAAFKLTADERKKVIRRLYKQWHPDKNLDNKHIATAAFQFLQQEITRLESGKPDMESYSRFYEEWNSEAHRHRQQHETYQNHYHRYRNRHRSSSSYSYVPPSFCTTTPNPREARVWFRQAEQDLQSANNDLNVDNPSYNWVCFKVHQAVEKALKAAKYSIDGKPKHDSTSLLSLAYAIQTHSSCPTGLDEDTSMLDKLGCDFSNTRYPRHHLIPSESYNKQQAEDAVKVASRMLKHIKDFIGIQKF